MDSLTVDRIVNALLYEGYILYPYRASSRKNRQRFTFGRIYPRAYSAAQGEAEPFVMQTECLLRRRAGGAGFGSRRSLFASNGTGGGLAVETAVGIACSHLA